MSLFEAIATITLSEQWQFTDVLVGSYFRVVHLSEPTDGDGEPVASSAFIAQADITGFIYTQDDFSHQSEIQSFILEQPPALEVRKLGFRLLPGQSPWQIRLEALDVTLLPAANGYSMAAIDGMLALKADLAVVYTKAEVDALLALKVDKPTTPPRSIVKSKLVWTPSFLAPYSGLFAWSSNPALLVDGNATPGNGIVVEAQSSAIGIVADFAAPVFLNQVKAFFGHWSAGAPTDLKIRSSSGQLLAEVSVSSASLDADLLSFPALDTPLSQYVLSFEGVPTVAINEIELYGETV